MSSDVRGQLVEMELGLASAVVRLDQDASCLAVWDDTLEPSFQTAATTEDDDGRDRRGEKKTLVDVGAGCRDFSWRVGKSVHCSGDALLSGFVQTAQLSQADPKNLPLC